MGEIASFAFLAWETFGQKERRTERELSAPSEETEVFTSTDMCFIEQLVGEGSYPTVYLLLFLSPVRLRILSLEHPYFWIFGEGAVPWRHVAVHWYCIVCHSHNPSCSSSSHFKTQPKRSWCCCACLAFEMRSVKLPQQPFWGCWLHFCFCHPFLCGVFFCFLKCEERRIFTVQIRKSFHNLSLLSYFFSFSEVADYGGSLLSPFFSFNNGAHLMWRVQRESALPTIWSLMFGFGTGRWGRWACLQNLGVCFHVHGFQGLPVHPALLSCPAYHCEQCCGPGPLLEVWYALSSQAAVSWFTVFAVLCLPEAGLAQLRSEM